MTAHERPAIGNLLQSLSLRISDMQREIAELRQDVKTLTYVVRQLQAQDRELGHVEQDTVAANEE